MEINNGKTNRSSLPFLDPLFFQLLQIYLMTFLHMNISIDGISKHKAIITNARWWNIGLEEFYVSS